MKVLQVCAYAAPYEGNFMKSLGELERRLKEKGVETVYAFPESAADIPWCRQLAQRAKVYFLPLSKARIRPATYRALRSIYRENPDIEVAHSHFELYDVPVEKEAPRGVKVFWHLHDAIESFTDMRSRLINKVQYGLMHGKATLLSVSEKHMSYAVKLGFPESRAVWVPNGIDTERIRFTDRDYADRKYDFLMFGWGYERKGVDICVKAVRSMDTPVRVAVIGGNDTAQRIAEEFGDVPGVEVLSPVEDVNELYNDSKCFLHISRGEGLSYALLEAVYAGLDVICSDIPENRFAFEFPSVTAVKCEDTEDTAHAMTQIAAGGVSDAECRKKSRQAVFEKYSIEKWVENIIEYYGK